MHNDDIITNQCHDVGLTLRMRLYVNLNNLRVASGYLPRPFNQSKVSEQKRKGKTNADGNKDDIKHENVVCFTLKQIRQFSFLYICFYQCSFFPESFTVRLHCLWRICDAPLLHGF